MMCPENKESKEGVVVPKKETIAVNPHLTSWIGSATLGETTYKKNQFYHKLIDINRVKFPWHLIMLYEKMLNDTTLLKGPLYISEHPSGELKPIVRRSVSKMENCKLFKNRDKV